ncbi:MAG: KH domain-containing protein [Firmicutes bacterium]|nr:KH domain-containing protein [Bacillota bacterium]
MITLYNYEGKSKEEINNKIKEELNIEDSELFLTITKEEGKLFKAKKYFAEVCKKEDIIEYVKEYIRNIEAGLNCKITSEVKFHEDVLKIILVSDNNSILIGKEGRTLESIQTLIRNSIKNQTNINIKINLDASNYKAKKQKNLEYEIKKIAKDVLKTHIEVKLDPMNSYDRRCVHNVISKFENLKSLSYGESPNRYVVISYKED